MVNQATVEKLKQIVEPAFEKAARLEKRIGELEKASQRPRYFDLNESPDWVKRFGENSEVKAVIGGLAKTASIAVERFFETKDLSASTFGEGAVVAPQRIPGIYGPQRMVHLRDVIPAFSVGSNSVEFLREKLFTDAAEVTDDHTQSVEVRESEYGLKPRSDIDFEKITCPVVTVAHWVPATRQAIQDVPSLLGYVQGRLLEGLLRVEDDLILNSVQGVNAFSGFMETVTQSADQIGTGTELDVILEALGIAETAGEAADAIILHPADWSAIRGLKDKEKRYLGGSPFAMGPGTIWGVPVMPCVGVDEGSYLLGAFRSGAALFDREQGLLRISESHEDYFTRNLLALLAEERFSLGIYSPQAFVKGTFVRS